MTHKRIQVKVGGVVYTVNPLKQHIEVLWIRQSGRCFWCSCQMIRKDMRNPDGSLDGRKCTVDHLIAQAAGGSDDISNLVAACHSCNQLRGDNNTLHLGDRIRKLVAQVTSLNKSSFEQKATLAKSRGETVIAVRLAQSRLLEMIKVREHLVQVQEELKVATRSECISWWCRRVRRINSLFK